MSRFTIVSMCGGGMRGLLSARLLERLVAIQPNILNTTTLFAGTSTGSAIINYVLAGWRPAQISEYYLNQARGFFEHKVVNKRSDKPRYDIAEVAAGLFAIHGDKKLSDFQQKVLFTAFYVGGKSFAETSSGGGKPAAPPFIPWGPRLYTNLSKSGTPSEKLVDAVTQSSAMPGMMGSWQSCVDGAFVNHDPTLAAIAAAVENGASLDNIAVINLGTGLMPDWVSDDTSMWGAKQWIEGGPHRNEGDETPPFFLNWEKPTPALDMALNGTSANLTPLLAKKLLGAERYVNLNPTLDWYIPEDSTSEKDMLELQGKALACDLSQAEVVLRNWSDAQ